MTETLDHLKIKNNALAMIGAGAIMSEDEDTELNAQVSAIYDARLTALLSIYEWKWAGKIFKLDRIAETVDNDFIAADQKFMNGWRYGFALPGTRVSGARKVLTDPRRPNDPLRDFFIEQNNLYADRETVYASFTVRADPSAWSALFQLAATTIIASDLCVPITHDNGLAASLRVTAEGTPQENGRGGLMGRAIGEDAAGGGSKSPLWRDPLTDARLR